MKLRAATRGSQLALWQTNHVAELLRGIDPSVEVEPVVVSTSGDRDATTPIWEIGGKGVFVKEVQAAVLDGRADIAVHSGKDLPADTPEGLMLAAVPERGDPRDALVGSTLADLPSGGRVATGSVRRRAQLADLRPDLTFAELRGNIATRLDKATEFDAVVVAAAALERLGLADSATEFLSVDVLLPQVAQGALAVECGSDALDVFTVLRQIEDPSSRSAVDAERGFLSELGGDCDLPAGAYAVAHGSGALEVDGLLASLDGRVILRDRRIGDAAEAEMLGRVVARHLCVDAGGSALLAG